MALPVKKAPRNVSPIGHAKKKIKNRPVRTKTTIESGLDIARV